MEQRSKGPLEYFYSAREFDPYTFTHYDVLARITLAIETDLRTRHITIPNNIDLYTEMQTDNTTNQFYLVLKLDDRTTKQNIITFKGSTPEELLCDRTRATLYLILRNTK